MGTKALKADPCHILRGHLCVLRSFNRVLKDEKVGTLIFIHVDDYIITVDSHQDLVRTLKHTHPVSQL